MKQERPSSSPNTIPIIKLNRDFDVVSFNESASQLFNSLKFSKLKKGSPFRDYIGRIEFSEIKERLTSGFEGLTGAHPITFRGNLKLRASVAPVIDDTGEIINISLVFDKNVDLSKATETEDHNLKEQLEFNKQIYENLFYNNPDAVYSFDLEGNFINANQKSAELAETTIEKLLEMHFLPFIEKDDQEKVVKHFEKAALGEVQSYKASFRSTKGTKKFLEITNFPIYSEKEIIGVYGIAKDITAQTIAETKITEEREMLRAIIDNIPDYIFVKNRDHKSILSNRKFNKDILGIDDDKNLQGFSPKDYFEEEEALDIIDDNNRVLVDGESILNRPDIVKNIKGKEERVLLTKVPLRNQKDEIIGLVGIARDITETYLHNKKQELIFNIIKVIGEADKFQDAMINTLELFCRDFDFDYAEAYKVSVDEQKLIRTGLWPKNDQEGNTIEEESYDLGEGVAGLVWKNNKTVIARGTDKELLESSFKNRGNTFNSAVGFPVIFNNKLVSIICLASNRSSKKIGSRVLKEIAVQIAAAIEGKRTQNMLNAFFKYSPNLIAAIGLDGYIKTINPSFEYKFGYSEAEILTKPFTEFIHPDDLKKTYEAIEKMSVGTGDFEIRCKRKDGKYLWISWRFSQYFENENALFIYGTDISEIKLSEQKLLHRKQRFKALVQEGSDLISILDSKLNFKYNSPASNDIFGIAPSELKDRNFRDFINTEDLEEVDKFLEKLSSEKQVQLPSFRIKNKSGNWRWIETIVTNLEDDPSIRGIVLNSRDITEFIEQEKKLMESLERYNIVAKATSDLITDYDIKNDKLTVSGMATEMLGYKKEEIGNNAQWLNERIHPEDYDEVRKLISELYEKGKKNLTTEYRFKCADNSYKYILDRSYLIKNENEDPIRIIGSMQDITDRKQHLLAIEQHNKRLREIAWNQSHVVRAPLARIMGLIDLLLTSRNDLKNFDEILENILTSSEELDKIIRRIAVQTENEL